VVGEEDAAYIESFGSSLSSDRSSETSDGILGQMLTYVSFPTKLISVVNVYLFF